MATIVHVAKHAGVSTATVSYVLSGKRYVAPETQQRVLDAINALGFRPNTLASGMRKQRTHTVALIIPDITNPYYPMLARGLQDALLAEKYHVFLCNTDAQRDLEREWVNDVVAAKVSGIVLVAFVATLDDIQEALAAQIPIVTLGERLMHPEIDTVSTDDTAGAGVATASLIANGHRHIGFIGDTQPGALEPRFIGFVQALTEAGLTVMPEWCITGDFTRAGGERAMAHLLTLPTPPTAIFCANDLLAIGAMNVARQRGLRVPEDVAIVGYDDIDAAAMVMPALTTVLNPAYEMGRTAGELLLTRMQQTYDGARREVIVPHQFIPRESS